MRAGACTLLGVALVDQRENPLWQPGGRHPRVAYQAYFRLEAAALLPFAGRFEATGRAFAQPRTVPLRHHDWHPVLRAALAAATGSAD